MIDKNTPHKQVGLREFQRTMYKFLPHIEQSALILTKNKLPAFVVITHDEWQRLVKPFEHRGIPVIQRPDVPEGTAFVVNENFMKAPDKFFFLNPSEPLGFPDRPFWQKIKKLLNHKLW